MRVNMELEDGVDDYFCVIFDIIYNFYILIYGLRSIYFVLCYEMRLGQLYFFLNQGYLVDVV